jgi:hypothetical protein
VFRLMLILAFESTPPAVLRNKSDETPAGKLFFVLYHSHTEKPVKQRVIIQPSNKKNKETR